MKTNSKRSFNKLAIILGSALLGLSSYSAMAATIQGTYLVTDTKTCVISSWRAAATPAYFNFSTSDNTPYGYLQVPSGTTYTDAVNNTWRTTQTDKYVMTVNPTNNAINITDGAFHDLPAIVLNANPPLVADFGTFTGNGSYAHTAPNQFVDVTFQTMALAGDDVSQIQNTTTSAVRFQTRDQGATIFSITGRGGITLQHNLTSNLYRDRICTSYAEGRRISTSY
ncbi:MAG: hypothetical protein ACXU7D_04025 [Burkholderiaceae bacterium]